jgi:hypothetical protein
MMFEKNHSSFPKLDLSHLAIVKLDPDHYASPKKNNIDVVFWAGCVLVNVDSRDSRVFPGACIEEPTCILQHWDGGGGKGGVFEVCVADINTAETEITLEYAKSAGILEKMNTRFDKFISQLVQADSGGKKVVVGTQLKPEACPVPVRVSSRATKGERTTIRLEDEQSPERCAQQKRPVSTSKKLQQELSAAQVKLAQWEGMEERWKNREADLIRLKKNQTNAASDWKQKCSKEKIKVKELERSLRELKREKKKPVEQTTPEVEEKLVIKYTRTKRAKLFRLASEWPKEEEKQGPPPPQKHYPKQEGHPPGPPRQSYYGRYEEEQFERERYAEFRRFEQRRRYARPHGSARMGFYE